ncbi:MAG: hypothetical protein ACSHYA_02150 [Opitutaceae bacterium]
MAINFQHLSIGCVISVALFLSGCDNAEPTSYQIPKETREVNMPSPPTAEKTAPPASSMNVLPGMQAAADAAGELSYTVPEGWTEMPASGIRKANFRVEDENGSAELTVTVFPGDVGGRLGNINRWRQQIGLDPVTADDLPPFTESYTISKHRGLIVTLEGSIDSILGGLLPFHGNTWFFKLQGKTDTVLANKDSFKAFLDSVALPDTHH